jgi:hypothetical protein
MHRALLSAVLSLSVLFSPLVAVYAASYTFITLDPPGATRTTARAINDDGRIVGYYTDSCRCARTSSAIPENSVDFCARMVRMTRGAYLRTAASCLRTTSPAHAG